MDGVSSSCEFSGVGWPEEAVGNSELKHESPPFSSGVAELEQYTPCLFAFLFATHMYRIYRNMYVHIPVY